MSENRDILVGLLTPQANPTVEAEMAILLPPDVMRVVARLRSGAERWEDRLVEYLTNVRRTIRDFDTLAPRVIGFACTASSYLVDDGLEAATVHSLALDGVELITAAGAVHTALAKANVKRIGLISPYPRALGEAALQYWRNKGFEPRLAAALLPEVADTRSIYRLRADTARAAIEAMSDRSFDALLVTGTGMPSLPLLADPPPHAPPLIASNHALATAILAALNRTLPSWHDALARATGDSS